MFDVQILDFANFKIVSYRGVTPKFEVSFKFACHYE